MCVDACVDACECDQMCGGWGTCVRAVAAAGRRRVWKEMGYERGPDRVEGGNE